MKTILYVDGFNLFYRAVKGTPLRWLNPVALIERAFPHNQIIKTKFFTAKVNALPNNPGQPIRQMIFCSDLVTPIRLVRDELKKTVGILNPQRLSGPNCRPPRKNAGLQLAASFYQNGVTWAQLLTAQFHDNLTDTTGAFHKPPTWA